MQGVNFASMDVLYRYCTPAQLFLVNFFSDIKCAGRPVPNLDHLEQPAILFIGRIDSPVNLIDFGELHRISRVDRSFVIRYDTRIFSRLVGRSNTVILDFLFLLIFFSLFKRRWIHHYLFLRFLSLRLLFLLYAYHWLRDWF